MMKPSILHLSTYLQGGAGLMLRDLAIQQKLEGWKVRVAVSDTEYSGYGNYPEHIDLLQQAGIEVWKVDSLFKREQKLNDRVVSFLTERLRSDPPNILHAHAAIPAKIGMSVAANLRLGRHIPVVQTMQGWGNNKTPAQEKQDVSILNRLEAVVAVSESSKRLLLDKRVSEKLIKVIPNGVKRDKSDVGLGELDSSLIRNMKSEFPYLIGCIGSICARKNQEVLIDAVELLNGKGFKVGLILVGEESEPEALTFKIQQKGLEQQVKILGYRKNARSILPHMDLFCLPSLSEGLPLSVLECFCDQVLVAGSRIPSIQELVRDEQTGFLFDPHDAKSVSETIFSALQLGALERAKLLNNAHSVFAENYEFGQVAASYERLYNEVSLSRS